MVHLTVVLSVVCFGTMILSLGILFLPALTAAFIIGKDVILRRFDVNDSVSRRFFRYAAENLKMMKYFPIQLIAMFQAAGIFACGRTGLNGLGYVLAASMAFFFTVLIYAVTYHVFCKPYPEMAEVLIAMFYKVQNLLAVWMLTLVAALFAGVKLLGGAMIVGAIPLILAEAAAFIGIISFRKAGRKLTEAETADIGSELLERF